jgi:hypothetical protein
MSRLGASLILFTLLFVGGFASDAQAHGVHGAIGFPTAAPWAEIHGPEREALADLAGDAAATDCDINCCPGASCAAAALQASRIGIGANSTDTKFVLPANPQGKPSQPDALKRPPRA